MTILRSILSFFVLMQCCVLYAESWDQIRNSGEYYWGVGHGETEEEADRGALANLISNIATHVSSDFTQIDDEKTDRNGVSHESRVHSCVKSYSNATMTNAERWVTGTAPNFEVRRYMKKSELARIFEGRIEKAKGMIRIAGDCLSDRKIDLALQHYYWAYSLLRSLQYPSEVKDDAGHILVDWIPVKINEILADTDVRFDEKDGDDVLLTFTYKGQPVSSIDFTYSDGRQDCPGRAKDGRGVMEMAPGYETDVYHVDIEYEFKNQARGEAEMSSVLAVITPRSFPKSAMKVEGGKGHSASTKALVTSDAKYSAAVAKHTAVTVQETAEMGNTYYANVIDKVAKAIATRNYSDAAQYFTTDGLAMYNRLVSYGRGRIIGVPEIKYYGGLGGRTIARGLQMAFTFEGKRKKTFVEDLTFTFNADKKIENVAFGLGKVAEDGILNHPGAAWREDVRESIVEFMENYKTAYSLEDIEYIRSIFADDATIIVGNVAKPRSRQADKSDGLFLSLEGQENIQYNRYTKDQYLKQLQRCFGRNDFINLKFTDHQIQWLEKFDDRSLFAINIRQQYDSSTYADDGYLFLLVDMTDREEPLIKIRTWQPNEVELSKLYNAGDFFDD